MRVNSSAVSLLIHSVMTCHYFCHDHSAH